MSKALISVLAVLVVVILVIMVFANPFARNNNIQNQNNDIKSNEPQSSASGSSGTGQAISDAAGGGGAASSSGPGSSGGGSVGGDNSEYGGEGALFLPDQGVGSNRISCSEINLSACNESSPSVCGWYDSNLVKCSIGPCVSGFTNECDACSNKKVKYVSYSECPLYG